ncbi:DUF2267 domain-containing protein [Streptomyces diastatochromogenes]|uniref:hypothetical protein n=1 Tax=Streptomyces diastatochromogenes TaxID=42236 RepID=UPI0036A940CF
MAQRTALRPVLHQLRARLPVETAARIRSEFPYAVEGGSEKLVRTVLKTLERHVSAGEWQHLTSRVPNSFAALLP